MEDAVVRALAAAGPGDVGSAAKAKAFLEREGEAALRRRFGGETTCVEVSNAHGGRIVIDFGSGARVMANAAIAAEGPVPKRPFTVLMSHMHWDHVQGFPFFAPAFIPGNTIRIGGCHGGETLKTALLDQFRQPHFPVPADVLGAKIETFDMSPGETVEIEGFDVTPFKLNHTGDSYGYRFDYDGASVVFASDAEHRADDIHEDYDYVKWIKGADVLIFDAQYALADLVLHKEDWGHSSGLIAVDLAHLGCVTTVILTHHDPGGDDIAIGGIEAQAIDYQDMLREGGASELEIAAAWDGMVREV